MSLNEKQLQIIDAAEVLFAERGFEGTSVRDIAEAAGVNLAMISYYFGSKEKLMEALFDLRTGHVGIRVESMLNDDSLAPMEKVFRLIDEHVSKAMDRHLFYKIMVTEQLINKNSSITMAVMELKKKNLERVTKLLEDGQSKGDFKKDVDVFMLMNTLIGTISQSVMNKQFFKIYHGLENISDEEFRHMIKEAVSNYLKKIFKQILSNEA